MAGNEEWRGSARSQAAVRRLFYVAMTRARETLVLCAPGGKTAVRF
jgi:ATP-dependent exoDNAse (exonuclease V) beta subunit